MGRYQRCSRPGGHRPWKTYGANVPQVVFLRSPHRCRSLYRNGFEELSPRVHGGSGQADLLFSYSFREDTMPRACSICERRERQQIDQAGLTGASYRDIARRFGASHSAVHRHSQHVSKAIAAAVEEDPAAYGRAVLAQVRNLTERSVRMIDRAESEGDRRDPRGQKLPRIDREAPGARGRAPCPRAQRRSHRAGEAAPGRDRGNASGVADGAQRCSEVASDEPRIQASSRRRPGCGSIRLGTGESGIGRATPSSPYHKRAVLIRPILTSKCDASRRATTIRALTSLRGR